MVGHKTNWKFTILRFPPISTSFILATPAAHRRASRRDVEVGFKLEVGNETDKCCASYKCVLEGVIFRLPEASESQRGVFIPSHANGGAAKDHKQRLMLSNALEIHREAPWSKIIRKIAYPTFQLCTATAKEAAKLNKSSYCFQSNMDTST